MKWLLYDMGAYTQNDIMSVLSDMGIEYKNVLYKLENLKTDAFFEKRILELLEQDTYDVVFSVNYYPVLAGICYRKEVPYVAWSYDSPIQITGIEATLGYPTNYVFFFDRQECKKYWKKGYRNIYHLPLAVNTVRLDKLLGNFEKNQPYTADISMVGQLYDTSFENLLLPIPEYEKGYLTAVTEIQMKLYGCYILNEVITDEILDHMNAAYEAIGQKSVKLTKQGLITSIAKYITHLERSILLETLEESVTVHLYGPDKMENTEGIVWHGSAGYFDEMPLVFRKSKINLNVTLKCIEGGIPLRVLDIMGSGGFVLTNYQEEIAEHFRDGEEVVMYTSLEDAVEKCHYYLENDVERERIAWNGYQRVKEEFGYEQRMQKILEVVSEKEEEKRKSERL